MISQVGLISHKIKEQQKNLIIMINLQEKHPTKWCQLAITEILFSLSSEDTVMDFSTKKRNNKETLIAVQF